MEKSSSALALLVALEIAIPSTGHKAQAVTSSVDTKKKNTHTHTHTSTHKHNTTMLSSTANLLRRTVTNQIGRRSFAVAAAPGQQLSDLAEKWPHADAIRYEWKNTKWTFREVDVSDH